MLVSVIVPVYDTEQYVVEALNSVIGQTHRDLEMIVVDDGSADRSVEAVTSVRDSRLRLLRQSNRGVAAARNAGLADAHGEVAAFLDADDAWKPTKLAEQLPRFDTADVAIVGSLLTYVGDSGRSIGTSGEIADHQQERIAAARLMPFAPSSMVVRTSVVREVGGFDEDLARYIAPVDDLDLVSRVARHYRVVTVPKSLGYYRVHTESASSAKFRAMQRATRYLQARSGNPDLAWETWDASTHDSFMVRTSERARFLYRLAGMRIACGDSLRGLAALAAAIALAPTYSIPRLKRQLSR
jgi:glycosyltransferase involved in cell wall biosynthesis